MPRAIRISIRNRFIDSLGFFGFVGGEFSLAFLFRQVKKRGVLLWKKWWIFFTRG